MAKVSVSILGCDQTRIGEQVLEAERNGADLIHFDVMDGVYVENLCFGPQLAIDLKKISKLPISAHLELLRPETFLPMFTRAGVDILTFQLDACPNPIHLLKEIKKAGMKAGIGIGPAYSVEGLRYILHHVDWLILMSVEPGYGGQTFEESVYEKIHQAKALMDELGHHVPISIDGGVNDVTGKKLIEAGADILIAGSYIFKDNKVAERVQSLKTL